MTFTDFMNEWIGKSIDYDHVYRFQCVDVILEGLYELYGINGAYGNAIDFWTNPDPKLLTKFSKVEGSDALEGDIVVLYGLPGNPDGHIGWATGNVNSTDIEILEQNGQTGDGSGQAGDAVRTRYINRSRVAGILRAKRDVVFSPTYILQAFNPHDMVVTGTVNIWDLTTPQADVAVGDVYPSNYRFTAQGKALHNDGRTYYMPDVNVPHGFLDENCTDYIIPVPLPPAAPVPIPTSTEPYTVIKVLTGYATSNDAANHTNSKGNVAPGNYYLFNRRTVSDTGIEVLNVTKVPGQAGSWINSTDNVPDPEPTPIIEPPIVAPPVVIPPPVPQPDFHNTAWRATYVSFNQQRVPVVYKALNNLVVSDISGSRGSIVRVPKGQHINVYGTFTRNNTKYGRLKIKADVEFKYFYGVRLTDIQKVPTMNLTPLTRAMDYFSLNKAKIEAFEDDAIKFLDMPFKIFKKDKR